MKNSSDKSGQISDDDVEIRHGITILVARLFARLCTRRSEPKARLGSFKAFTAVASKPAKQER
jgi:hypothetical protein